MSRLKAGRWARSRSWLASAIRCSGWCPAPGEIIAQYYRASAGAEQTIRSTEHARLLEAAVLDAFTTQTTYRSKVNRPPGPDALAELARLRGIPEPPAPVISLGRYAELATVAC